MDDNYKLLEEVIFCGIGQDESLLHFGACSSGNTILKILDEFELDITAWAPEFTYEQYVNEYDEEFSELDKLNWDVEEKSIERATEDGYWLETGTCIIDKPDGVELRFEFNLTDGERDVTLATPYDKDDFEMPNCFPFSY
jgi:hypothetical protein